MKIQLKIPFKTNINLRSGLSSLFWFTFGFVFTAIFLSSFLLSIFKYIYKDKAYEGIYIDNVYVGGKSRQQIKDLFDKKNQANNGVKFTFSLNEQTATFSALEINAGYNSNLMRDQAFSLGRTGNVLTNTYIIINSYLNGISLPKSYSYSSEIAKNKLDLIEKQIFKEPVDALFTVENNRVIAFRQSSEGQTIDFEALDKIVNKSLYQIMEQKSQKNINIKIPVKILKPLVTTEKANHLGIVEIIGEGKSLFAGSIPNRIHNVTLASSRINGILVGPNSTFSFNDTLGDVSNYTGYKQAYIIKDGKTILGDGGGVCQVSTTLFRALLNSGLPITERHPHSYRVGYYEQNSPPGFDATVYAPSVDLKFKNDTSSYILIQSNIDPDNLSLVFTLYGRKDNRQVTISNPILTNVNPPPPPLYQDDPTLLKGEEKQVEFAVGGANVMFTRKVEKDGKILYNDVFSSRYTPWQAVYLRGTKEP